MESGEKEHVESSLRSREDENHCHPVVILYCHPGLRPCHSVVILYGIYSLKTPVDTPPLIRGMRYEDRGKETKISSLFHSCQTPNSKPQTRSRLVPSLNLVFSMIFSLSKDGSTIWDAGRRTGFRSSNLSPLASGSPRTGSRSWTMVEGRGFLLLSWTMDGEQLFPLSRRTEPLLFPEKMESLFFGPYFSQSAINPSSFLLYSLLLFSLNHSSI